MKNFRLITVLALILSVGLVAGCESGDTKASGMNGMVLIDANGKKWIAKHNLGDNYILYGVKEDGSIAWEGN